MHEDENEAPEEHTQDRPEPEPPIPGESESGQIPGPESEPPAPGENEANLPSEPTEPVPPLSTGNANVSPPGPRANARRDYVLGLVLGLLPILSLLITFNLPVFMTVLCIAGIFYLMAILVMIACLANKKSRVAGYGLLTAVLISPIIVAIGCVVILSRFNL
jgi:hypothetical protein